MFQGNNVSGRITNFIVAVEADSTVIEGKGQALLGKETATQHKVESCFEDLGKLKNFDLHIPIDQKVKGMQNCVPFSLRQVRKEA